VESQTRSALGGEQHPAVTGCWKDAHLTLAVFGFAIRQRQLPLLKVYGVQRASRVQDLPSQLPLKIQRPLLLSMILNVGCE
jgi:hypothetical protein